MMAQRRWYIAAMAVAVLALLLCAATTVNARDQLDDLLADHMPYDSQ